MPAGAGGRRAGFIGAASGAARCLFPEHGACAAGREGSTPEDTYLPVSIERVRVYADVPHRERLLVLAERSSCDARAGSFRVNLRLLSEEGQVIADVTAMEAQRVARHDAAETRSSLYTLRWVAEAAVREPSGIPRLRQENWIVFADGSGVGDTLAEALIFGGGVCTLVRPGKEFAQTGAREYAIRPEVRDDLDELLRQSGTPTAVVHLWSLRGESPQNADAGTASRPGGGQRVCSLDRAGGDGG